MHPSSPKAFIWLALLITGTAFSLSETFLVDGAQAQSLESRPEASTSNITPLSELIALPAGKPLAETGPLIAPSKAPSRSFPAPASPTTVPHKAVNPKLSAKAKAGQSQKASLSPASASKAARAEEKIFLRGKQSASKPLTPLHPAEAQLDTTENAVVLSPTPAAPAATPAELKPKALPVASQPEPLPPSSPPLAKTSPATGEIPAVDNRPRPAFSWRDLNPFQDEKAVKPVSYSPLPGIVIFPVVKQGREKAFSDLPLLFASQYAQRMEAKVPETKVYHPVYTVDELRMQGLGHVYDQILKYYVKAGRPEPTALDYLVKQLGTRGQVISRVIFVEADLDTDRPLAVTSLIELAKARLTDGTPKEMKYFINSRIQVFNAEKPEYPMIWGGSWSRTVKKNRFINVTASVYGDSDSQQAFARVSREMCREVLFITPKEAYMNPEYATDVQAKLVKDADNGAIPNLSDGGATGASLARQAKQAQSDAQRQAVQRILRH